MTRDIEQLSIDTIRTLAMDAVQHANSGHPGLPMGMAPAAYLLYTRILEHNPKDDLLEDGHEGGTLGATDESRGSACERRRSP